MWLKCSCGNVYRVSKYVDGNDAEIDVSCPLHPDRKGNEITSVEKYLVVSTYGMAVGSIEKRKHGYYEKSGGGKVLVHRQDHF